VGLTGTPNQVECVCKSYRVYYSKAREDDGMKSDDDYVLDHSIILYLMDTEGVFVDHFGVDMTDKKIIDKISKHVQHFLDQRSPDKMLWWKKWIFYR